MSYPESAACTSRPRLFFGPEGETLTGMQRRERKAKTICHSECPVRDECLTAAIVSDEIWGVWGGTGEKERQRYLSRLRAVSTARGGE